ncbi:MAG: hypothetical protein KF713_18910 [Turneriella sp.]|nr:hypothetical protein [Turneriella sp.]
MINISDVISRLDAGDLEVRIGAYDDLLFETPVLHPDWYAYFAAALEDESPTMRLYGVLGILCIREKYSDSRVLAALLDHENETHPGMRMFIETILAHFFYADDSLLHDRIRQNHPSAGKCMDLQEKLGHRKEILLDQMEDLIVRLMNRHPKNPRLRNDSAKPFEPLDSIWGLIKFTN